MIETYFINLFSNAQNFGRVNKKIDHKKPLNFVPQNNEGN